MESSLVCNGDLKSTNSCLWTHCTNLSHLISTSLLFFRYFSHLGRLPIYRKSETTCNLLSNTLSKSIWIMHIFQQFPFVCICFGAIYNKNGYQFLDKGIIFDSFPFSQKHFFFFFFCENISKTYQPKYLLFFSIYYNHTTTPIVRSWQKHL